MSERSEAMNRALVIILIPALLVLGGYILVFRMMGISPGYSRLVVTVAAFAGVSVWLWRRGTRKKEAPRT